jgi:hypothetical protein
VITRPARGEHRGAPLEGPPAGAPAFPLGEGTFSATPLAWSHAQYVRLAHSIDAGRVHRLPARGAGMFTVLLRKASGAGYYAMAGQGFDPDFIFSWPTGRMGVMEGESAVMAVHGPEIERAQSRPQRRAHAADPARELTATGAASPRKSKSTLG